MASSIDAGDVLARIESSRRAAPPDAFLSLTLPPAFDPRRLLDDPQGAGVVASYERPAEGLAMVAIGEAARIEAPWGAGPGALGAQARALVDRPGGGDLPGLRPRLLGGFRFDASAALGAPWEAFGAGWLVLPRVLFLSTGESNALILAPSAEAHDVAALVERAQRSPGAPLEPAAAPLRVEQPMDREHWLSSVATIASEVRAGLYEKAVLASTQQLAGDAPISIGRALARLRADYADCHLFTMTSGDSTFLGASPELLVSLTRGRVRALGLAGSTRRGVDPEEDERLGAALLESAKNRIEHETVVRAIRERLGGATEELLAPNHRPVQVTTDLPSFWANVYPQVRRELSRRYPRHSWPEDPLAANPEARPRRRRPD